MSNTTHFSTASIRTFHLHGGQTMGPISAALQELDEEEDYEHHLALKVPGPPSGLAEFALARYLYEEGCHHCKRRVPTRLTPIIGVASQLERICAICVTDKHKALRSILHASNAAEKGENRLGTSLAEDFLLTLPYWTREANQIDVEPEATAVLEDRCTSTHQLASRYQHFLELKSELSTSDFEDWIIRLGQQHQARRLHGDILNEYIWLRSDRLHDWIRDPSATWSVISAKVYANLIDFEGWTRAHPTERWPFAARAILSYLDENINIGDEDSCSSIHGMIMSGVPLGLPSVQVIIEDHLQNPDNEPDFQELNDALEDSRATLLQEIEGIYLQILQDLSQLHATTCADCARVSLDDLDEPSLRLYLAQSHVNARPLSSARKAPYIISVSRMIGDMIHLQPSATAKQPHDADPSDGSLIQYHLRVDSFTSSSFGPPVQHKGWRSTIKYC